MCVLNLKYYGRFDFSFLKLLCDILFFVQTSEPQVTSHSDELKTSESSEVDKDQVSYFCCNFYQQN